MGGIAFADNTVPDGDDAVPVAADPLAIGTVCINSTTHAHALVAISRNGNGTNVFRDGAAVTVSVLSVSGTGLSATMDFSTITMPSNWSVAANNTMSEAVSSKVTYQAGGTAGAFSGSVTYRASGLNANGTSINREATMLVSATRSNTGSCVPAPTDTTKPTVTVSFPSPVSGSNGYFNAADVTPVVGMVSASDASNVTNITCAGAALSGVTGYNTNTASGILTVTGDGTHNVICSATDGAAPANTGAAPGSANTATIKIDTTAPSISDGGYASGTAGSNGWYTSQVTNSFSASDATSGLADCAASFTRNSGTDQGSSVKIASGPCSDAAGNTNNGMNSAAYMIDKTGPSAILSATGTPGTHGWFTSNVTISTLGSDGISGPVTCTSDQSQTDETTGAVFNGRCTNQAGLRTDADPLTVKLDKTGPVAALTPSGQQGDNGWFTGNVTIKTKGSDDISSPVSCTDDQTQTDETKGTEFNGSCTNDAGLSTDASPMTVKLDKTGPSASLSATGTQGLHGWFTDDVTIKTTGSDDISGGVACTNDQSQTTETMGATFNGSCTNAAGLTTGALPLNVKLDKTGPTATQTPTGTDGSNGWFINDDVTVTTSGSDDVSEPVSCTGPQTQTDETSGTEFNAQCTNDAGLSTDAAPVTVKLDKTGPTATLTPTGTAGAHGWFTSDVTVTASGDDSISDPVTCSTLQSQRTETTGQVFTGSCTNDAGLSTDADPITVKVDKTGPSATLAPSGILGANGWFTSDVTISTSGSDDISGPATCTADRTQSTETKGQEFDGQCTNDAGLSTDADPISVKVDKTGPSAVLTPTGTAGAHGWFTSNVTITANGDDDISGGVICTPAQSQSTETTAQEFDGSCTNGAGLTTNAAAVTVKVDKTGPTAMLSALGTIGNNGWYVSDVTVQTTGADSISGPPVCSNDQSLVTDTAGQSFSGSCTNGAGITTNAPSLTVKRDATKPTLSPSVSPNPVILNGSATASASAWDATSGLFSSSCGAVDTSGIGSLKSVLCYATDNAGNTNTGSAPYGVVYNWFGFYQPVENLPTWNTAKAGQSIPVKFALGGNQGLNILKATYPKVTQITCPSASVLTDAIETYATTANNGLIYDASANQYNYVWKTDKTWAGKCFSFDLGLIDGTSHTFQVQFTK
jgi:hypothetical protein